MNFHDGFRCAQPIRISRGTPDRGMCTLINPATKSLFPGRIIFNGRARVYTQADQQRLLLILKGRKLGFTVSEISQMLVAAEDRRGPPHSLKIPRGKCLEQIELLERQLNDTHEALAEMRRLITC